MLRFILVALTVVLYLIVTVPVLIIEWLINAKDQQRLDNFNLKMIRGIFRFILKLSGVKVNVIGEEHIPPDTAVLYVGNHRSYFDILAGYTTIPSLLGFVAKKEMESIPLLSNWMKMVNCIFIDRNNIKAGLKSILDGINKVKSGISIWIFPEGTRNKNKDPLDLLPFKEGSFKIAEKTGCPIVPVALTGTADIFENHFPRITPYEITIHFGEPVYLKELPAEHKKFAGVYIRDIIIKMLQEQI